MARSNITTDYVCADDCVITGCPSHALELTYCSITNFYRFEGDHFNEGEPLYLDAGGVESMIDLLRQLSEYRADSVDVSEVC